MRCTQSSLLLPPAGHSKEQTPFSSRTNGLSPHRNALRSPCTEVTSPPKCKQGTPAANTAPFARPLGRTAAPSPPPRTAQTVRPRSHTPAGPQPAAAQAPQDTGPPVSPGHRARQNRGAAPAQSSHLRAAAARPAPAAGPAPERSQSPERGPAPRARPPPPGPASGTARHGPRQHGGRRPLRMRLGAAAGRGRRG